MASFTISVNTGRHFFQGTSPFKTMNIGEGTGNETNPWEWDNLNTKSPLPGFFQDGFPIVATPELNGGSFNITSIEGDHESFCATTRIIPNPSGSLYRIGHFWSKPGFPNYFPIVRDSNIDNVIFSFVGKVPGEVDIDGSHSLRSIVEDRSVSPFVIVSDVTRTFTVTGTSMVQNEPGYLWVEGNNLHWTDSNGIEQFLVPDVTEGAATEDGYIWHDRITNRRTIRWTAGGFVRRSRALHGGYFGATTSAPIHVGKIYCMTEATNQGAIKFLGGPNLIRKITNQDKAGHDF